LRKQSRKSRLFNRSHANLSPASKDAKIFNSRFGITLFSLADVEVRLYARPAVGVIMKSNTHPKYQVCNVHCACGNTFTTRSTLPRIGVDICNQCHPFFTGKQKFVDTAGRVERFSKKFGGTYSFQKSSPPPAGKTVAATK
jgi:ribosomal protein L31